MTMTTTAFCHRAATPCSGGLQHLPPRARCASSFSLQHRREKNPKSKNPNPLTLPVYRHEDLFHWSVAPTKQRMLLNSFTNAEILVAAQLFLPAQPGSKHGCGIAHSKGTLPGGQLAALLRSPGTGVTRWRKTPGMLVVSPSFSYAPSGPGGNVRQW